jgi:signal transduction histidine kinase
LETSELPSALSVETKKIIADTPLTADVKILGIPRKLADELEENLLRIGQEAITNTVKHGQAKSILVELTYGSDQVSIKIKDDGIGFNSKASAPEGHFGLVGMRERVSQLKGTFDLRSEPDKGTELVVTIPSR